MKVLFFIICSVVMSVEPQTSSVCRKEFEETICEDFTLLPELILDSATNKLTIRNASGPIIHENFVNLTQVTEIKITGSEISKIEPGALCCNANFTSITISGNRKFPKITKSFLQGCQNLKKLNLNGGAVLIEKGAFSANAKLQNLAINGTAMRDLQEGILAGLDSLKFLTIQHSQICLIREKAFRGLKNLKILDLQNNNIEFIEKNVFQNLPQLKVLNLADNEIKNLTWQEFDGLKALRVLFLERNNFDTVDVDKLVSGVPNLERIFLSYDKLTPQSRKRVEEVLPKFNITFIYIGKPYE